MAREASSQFLLLRSEKLFAPGPGGDPARSSMPDRCRDEPESGNTGLIPRSRSMIVRPDPDV
jgi:hypothetical protein